MKKLFIDDERFPPGDGKGWDIVRSSAQAIQYVSKNGMPDIISFDHDLGGDDTAVIFINWLTEQLIDGNVTIPPYFSFEVHSQNPIGANNIRGKMNQLLLHFGGYL